MDLDLDLEAVSMTTHMLGLFRDPFHLRKSVRQGADIIRVTFNGHGHKTHEPLFVQEKLNLHPNSLRLLALPLLMQLTSGARTL